MNASGLIRKNVRLGARPAANPRSNPTDISERSSVECQEDEKGCDAGDEQEARPQPHSEEEAAEREAPLWPWPVERHERREEEQGRERVALHGRVPPKHEGRAGKAGESDCRSAGPKRRSAWR
jgi:hypothetical protein